MQPIGFHSKDKYYLSLNILYYTQIEFLNHFGIEADDWIDWIYVFMSCVVVVFIRVLKI